MPGFVQIIEFTTSRYEEGRKLVDEYREKTKDTSTVTRGMDLRDRDNPNKYYTVVEFPSYEEAMRNSESPQTQELASKLAELGDGPPTFYNCDIVRVIEP
jgi:precorrin isomerase